ncbi:transposase [Effusibacillus lacus]|uniref:Transposase n=1 Tax=Effusibacillus lacus TaxID=1348429 RepID=A0A292YCG7_9BACL|nr:transposase [Effusibacillus lacus]
MSKSKGMANTVIEKSVIEISNSIEELPSRCLSLEQKIAELSTKVKWYEVQFRLAQHKRFGASSEKRP